MNKILHIWVVTMVLGAFSLANAQMVIKPLYTMYSNVAKNLPVLQQGTTFSLNHLQDSDIPEIKVAYFPVYNGQSYPFSDFKNKGAGPYDIINNGNLLIKGEEGITAYWSLIEAFKYFRNKFSYYGVNNQPNKITYLNIVGGYYYVAISSGFNKISIAEAGQAYNVSVLAHELTHLIMNVNNSYTSTICNTGYVNEGVSDIFGILAENYSTQQDDPSAPFEWGFNVGGKSLYYLKTPLGIKQSGFPVSVNGDNFDSACKNEHNNRTIVPYWFYLLSEGGTGNIDDNSNKEKFQVISIGTDRAEKILFNAITKKYLPSGDYSWDGLRMATLTAAKAEYGSGSVEYNSVADAWHAVGVGTSSAQLLSSVPADGAKDANPWPLNGIMGYLREIQYPDIEKQWIAQFSTDKDFKSSSPIYTTSTLTKASNTMSMNGKLYLVIPPINLQTLTTYYCRVETTGFDACHYGQTPKTCADLQTQLASGLDVRSFVTDGRDIDQAQIETPYPWGPAFHWATKADVAGSKIQYYILNIFHKDEKEPFIQKDYAPQAGATQFNPTTKPDYLILKDGTDYGWAVRAMGPNDVFGEKTFSLATRMDFKTNKVTSSLVFPDNKKTIDLFNYQLTPIAPIFLIKWDPAVNADGYRVELSKSETDYSSLVKGSETNYHGTQKSFNPGASADGNNTYFCRVTPLGPPLTNEAPQAENPGSTGFVHSFTYDYKSTKPQLNEFATVEFSQYQVPLTWKAVPGADYYKVSLTKRGFMDMYQSPLNNEQIIKSVAGKTAYGFTYTKQNIPYDISIFDQGYEWQVVPWRHEALLDFPGQAARSSYDLMPDVATINTPQEKEVLTVDAVTNQKVYYQVGCMLAPGGFRFTMGLEGQPTTFLTPNNVPYIIAPNAGSVASFPPGGNTGLFDFNIPGTLFWDHDYYAQFIPLGRAGSGIEGKGVIRHFHTPPEPVKKKAPDPMGGGTPTGFGELMLELDYWNLGVDENMDGQDDHAAYFIANITIDGPNGFHDTGDFNYSNPKLPFGDYTVTLTIVDASGAPKGFDSVSHPPHFILKSNDGTSVENSWGLFEAGATTSVDLKFTK